MSVFIHEPREIARMLGSYRLTRTDTGPEPEHLARALEAAHYANVAAYCLTYADWSAEEVRRFDCTIFAIHEAPPNRQAITPDGKRQLVRDLRSVLYNTVSNDGADFLPDSHRRVIEAAIRDLTDFLAEVR